MSIICCRIQKQTVYRVFYLKLASWYLLTVNPQQVDNENILDELHPVTKY